jgi:DSF synthase
MEVPQLSMHLATDSYRHLVVRFDDEHGAVWCYMQPTARPCFSPELLAEMRQLQCAIEQQARNDHLNGNSPGLRYQVLASRVPGVFNLGGDLVLFLEAIQNRDRDGLFRYAKSCIDMLYNTAVSYNLPLTTISLVQGEALGGGFEAALASNVLIAERSAQMGLPEILFNLFPGMGAYSLLARRLDPARAEKIILSGNIYSAEDMYEMGVVDVLVNDGEGEQAVDAYIIKQNRTYQGYQAVRRIRARYQPIDYQELLDITEQWVDAALQLQGKDLRIMDRLVHSQSRFVQPPLVERRAPDSPLRVKPVKP